MIASAVSNNTLAAIVAFVVVLLGIWYIWIMQQRLTVEMQKLKLHVQVNTPEPTTAPDTSPPDTTQAHEPPRAASQDVQKQSDDAVTPRHADGSTWHRTHELETDVEAIVDASVALDGKDVPFITIEDNAGLYRANDDLHSNSSVRSESVNSSAMDDVDTEAGASDSEEEDDGEQAASVQPRDEDEGEGEGEEAASDQHRDEGEEEAVADEQDAEMTIKDEFKHFRCQSELHAYLKKQTVQELKRVCAENSIAVLNPGGGKKLKTELIANLIETFESTDTPYADTEEQQSE